MGPAKVGAALAFIVVAPGEWWRATIAPHYTRPRDQLDQYPPMRRYSLPRPCAQWESSSSNRRNSSAIFRPCRAQTALHICSHTDAVAGRTVSVETPGLPNKNMETAAIKHAIPAAYT